MAILYLSNQVKWFLNIVTRLLDHLKADQTKTFSSRVKNTETFFWENIPNLFGRKFYSTLLWAWEKVFLLSEKFVSRRNNKKISRPRARALRTHCAAKYVIFEGSDAASVCIFALFILRVFVAAVKLNDKIRAPSLKFWLICSTHP